MQSSGNTFHLLDLPSQAQAVQALLAGRSLDEKVAWFQTRGKLSPLPKSDDDRQAYLFESPTGNRCKFFIAGDDLVFFGDNTTWPVQRRKEAHTREVRVNMPLALAMLIICGGLFFSLLLVGKLGADPPPGHWLYSIGWLIHLILVVLLGLALAGACAVFISLRGLWRARQSEPAK